MSFETEKRVLGSIQKIKKLETLEGYDRIVYAYFESIDYRVIVLKDEFKVGDLCIYIEGESMLPNRPEFEFLKKKCFKPSVNMYRITCCKMAGVFSEGIVFGLNLLPEEMRSTIKEEDNVTDILGLKTPSEVFGEAVDSNEESLTPLQIKIKSFMLKFKFLRPFIKYVIRTKTEETEKFPFEYVSTTHLARIQTVGKSIRNNLDHDIEIVITEKLDGSAGTYLLTPDNKFIASSMGVCRWKKDIKKSIKEINEETVSRYKEGGAPYILYTAAKYNLPYILSKYKNITNKSLAIQGEIIGYGIQSNKYLIDKSSTRYEFYVYSIFDIESKRYYDWDEIKEFCDLNHLAYVPHVCTETLKTNDLENITRYFEEKSKGKSALNPKINREGIVVKAKYLSKERAVRGMSNSLMFAFKVINSDFALKNKTEDDI